MGLFGDKDKKERENAQIQARFDQLEPLDIPDLANAVMLAAFGPDSPNHGTPIALVFVQQAVSESESVFGIDLELRHRLDELTQEGLQALEHAGLVVWTFSGGDQAGMSWRPTRAGRAAITAGSVTDAVRARLGA